MPLHPDFPSEVRVRQEGHIGLGSVYECTMIREDEVCVEWDSFEGREPHVPASSLRRVFIEPGSDGLADWERELLNAGRAQEDVETLTTAPTGDYEDTIRTIREAMVTLNNTTNRARQTIEDFNEGLTDQEGEEMPAEVVTISVNHNTGSRRRVFESLDITRQLMNHSDEETWLDHLRQLNELTKPIEWGVRRGSFRFEDYPQVEVNGMAVAIENLAIETAIEFVSAASDGKVTLVQRETSTDRRGAPQYAMSPHSDLERSAYEMYAGESIVPATWDEEAQTNIVGIRVLKDHMRLYYGYLRDGSRRQYLKRALRERMRASVNKAPEPVEWNTARIEKFSSFLDTIKSKLKPEANPFNKLPILPRHTLSSRTWGIEIEAPHIGGIVTPEYWELKSDGSLRGLATSNMISRSADPRYCNPPKIKLDASQEFTQPEPPRPRLDHAGGCIAWTSWNTPCNCGYQSGYDAWAIWERARQDHNRNLGPRTSTGEWNSPVLRSFHSRGLKHLTTELEPRRVNDTAGIHVHVGAKDLTPEQVVKLGIIYTALEPLFEKEYMRGSTRTYCESVNVSEMIARFKQAKNMKIDPNARMYSDTKYWTVNVNCLNSYGTIEFRAMGPIYNYKHLVRWAYLCRELVNIAKVDVPQSEWSQVRTIEDLVTLFSKYGKETPTPDWAASKAMAKDEYKKIVSGLGKTRLKQPAAEPLTAGSRLNLVNDDYSVARTFMQGDVRELARTSF